ncbi:MAG: branched-chain amino acid ABC transporter permease [Candidatus Methylomirabilia bacterium]
MRQAGVGVLILLLLTPFVVSEYLLHVLIVIAFWAYLGSCWNILSGYAGQLSIGHAAFVGVGAYTSSLLWVNFGVTPWVGLFAAAVTAGTVGLFLGFVSFHYGLRGPYFALATIAFAEVLRLITNNWMVLGAALGILIPLQGHAPSIFQFETKAPYYYTILAMVVGVLGVVRLVERSRFGYQMLAIRENEDTAESLGIDAKRVKLAAIGLSAALTGIGGAFYAQYYLYIDPATTFGISVSIDIMIRPIIGGMGTLWGPVVGSVILTPLSEVTRYVFGGRYAGVALMSYGAILMLVVLLAPGGVVSWVRAHRLHTPRRLGEETS